MAEALDPSAYVYEGLWRNLSKESAKSLTLTLSPTHAVILTNAFALFVAMSGGQLWTIIRFTLHQVRASSRSESIKIIHNQQQVVLRNATTDIATARFMLMLAWSSPKKLSLAVSTCMTILVLALFNAAFFMVAGTFSSKLIDAGPSVLTRSPHCGVFNQSYLDIAGFGPNAESDDAFELSVGYISKVEHDVQLSLEYAQACYMAPPEWYVASGCDVLEKSRLNFTKKLEDACPFESGTCSGNSQTIIFDTGYVNSHSDLGINAKPHDRVLYRRVTKCSVLNETAHNTDFIPQDQDEDIAYASYGPSVAHGTNETYSYSNFGDFFTPSTGSTTIPYQVGSAFAYGLIPEVDQRSSSSFDPISEIVQPDADLVLMFLSYIGSYIHAVDDPWFSAHQVQHGSPESSPLLQTTFTRDRPISTIGCTEQHQLCTDPEHCTDLLGFDQVQQAITKKLSLSPNQKVTVDRVLHAAIASGLFFIVQVLAFTSTPLLALSQTATGIHTLSLPIPVYQWQLELEAWHQTAMAHFQRVIIEYATGQIAPETRFLIPPPTAADMNFCQNVRIQSTAFQSFDVMSLALIFSFGALIILFSLSIEAVSGWLQRRWNRGAYGRQMWRDHDMLGLRRWRNSFNRYMSHNVSPVGMHDIKSNQGTPGGFCPPAFMVHPQWHGADAGSDRASSQALSSGDGARLFSSGTSQFNFFPRSPRLEIDLSRLQTPTAPGLSPSPIRSTFTADFVFDFSNDQQPATNVEKDIENWGEKPLPEVPSDSKTFCIDRGMEKASQVEECNEITQMPKPVLQEPVEPPHRSNISEQQIARFPEPQLASSGPGRWAYYSAHKRRYGPKLTPPAVLHVSRPNQGGLRGNFVNQGNWI
jgi:hypothetical protein